jgi:hypothetical protein
MLTVASTKHIRLRSLVEAHDAAAVACKWVFARAIQQELGPESLRSGLGLPTAGVAYHRELADLRRRLLTAS